MSLLRGISSHNGSRFLKGARTQLVAALAYDRREVTDENGKEIFLVKAAFWPPGYFPGVKTKYFFMCCTWTTTLREYRSNSTKAMAQMLAREYATRSGKRRRKTGRSLSSACGAS
ncbi:hypothetical protein ANCDUO_07005 [Ancylostoma duodenale]|uniref:Uncharacterized protein n=1 Tax=Ancylostoma duodenale TaxID=51022 RepID=A0A0C2H025_9BILA|nr:hypothetical protein ANCDUO_07005 [Ancylostoma duodenale]